MDRSLTDRSTVWGDVVVPGRYAGHDGFVYAVSPGSIPDMLLGTDRWDARDFVVQGDRRITHAEFHAAVEVAAARLADRGVRSGDHVMLLAYNSPDFVLAVLGAWWLGAVPVLANRWWSATELRHALDLTRPALLITDAPDVEATGTATLPVGDLAGCFSAPGADLEPFRPGDPDTPALVLFTSGSSGAPKGVVLSWRSVIANQQNLLARSRRLPQQLDDAAAQPVTLVCTPMFHIGGVSNILTNLVIGGRLVLTVGKFDPAEILRLIETERVQSWGGVPTMATRVIEHPDFERHDLSSLRSFPLGGAPLPPTLLERMTQKLPQLKQRGLANTWGMTESGGFVTVAGNADLERRPGTVGRPYPCAELRIAEPDEKGSGEVLLRSPTVMLGYLGVDDGTVDADGWLRTGDLGHLDDDGYLYLDGRSKDIVIRGGENIACAHVEKALVAHPDVVETAVFGVPHPELGEELAAVVTHRPGRPVSEDELRRHCRTVLAYFEVPSVWRISDTPLPTLAGEKVDKKQLRATLLAELAATGS